ncbi:heparan-alpha-glucosaminide N-acetyltransferase domain-containing protein [Micromonospora sp. LZ34]
MTSTIYRSRKALEGAGDPPAATTTSLPAQRSRLLGVDAARGVALFGMIAVHSLYVADEAGRPTWSFTIFQGRAAALFAVLAGVGIAFITGRRRVRRTDGLGPIAGLVVRALVIGAIGLALGYTDASMASVILPYYAVMFLMAVPLVFLPTWLVAFTGLAVAAGAPALRQILLPHLPEPTYQNPAFPHLIQDPGSLIIELSMTGIYPAVAWLAYLCAGLVIGRLALTRIKVVLSLLVTGVAFAVAAPVASWVLLNRYEGLRQIWFTQPKSGLNAAETTALLTFGGDGSTPTSTWWWLAVDAPHTSTPLDLLGTTGSAMALLAVLLLTGHVARPFPRRAISVLLVPLAAAGSMTLTLYTAHIMFINSELDTFEAMTGYLWQILAILLVAIPWWAYAGRGPLEALVAMLSRGARRLATGQARTTHVGLSMYPRAAPRSRGYSAHPHTTNWRGWRAEE